MGTRWCRAFADCRIRVVRRTGFRAYDCRRNRRACRPDAKNVFNHFPDKREVLFGPIAKMQHDVVCQGIAECPDSLMPLEAVVYGLQVAGETLFEPRRAAAKRRREVIDAHPELLERELGKRAVLTQAIADALRSRGVDSERRLCRLGQECWCMRRRCKGGRGRPPSGHYGVFFPTRWCSLRTIAAQTTVSGTFFHERASWTESRSTRRPSHVSFIFGDVVSRQVSRHMRWLAAGRWS